MQSLKKIHAWAQMQVPLSNWSLFKLIRRSANNIEMNFCLNMCSLMGKRLAAFQKRCLSIHIVFG